MVNRCIININLDLLCWGLLISKLDEKHCTATTVFSETETVLTSHPKLRVLLLPPVLVRDQESTTPEYVRISAGYIGMKEAVYICG